MHIANIHEAKADLSGLIERAAAGEEIIIVRNGKRVARLIAYEEQTPPRRTPGIWKGKMKMTPDFDDLPEAIAVIVR